MLQQEQKKPKGVESMSELDDRKEIVECLRNNVFVEAGAGAGKTTLIVARIVNQLRQGISPKAIVVITFTNAAAEVLRSRIIDKVREASTCENYAQEERERLREALLQLDLMNISTIHSFCFKLLQERTFDAKLPMDVQLLDKNVLSVQHNKFFTMWAGKLTSGDWSKFQGCDKKNSEVLSDMKSLFRNICELPDDTEFQYDTSCLNRNPMQEIQQLVQDFQQVFCDGAKMLGLTSGSLRKISDDGLYADARREIRDNLLKKEIPYFQVLRYCVKKKADGKKKFFNVKKENIPEGVDLEAVDKKCRDWGEANASRIKRLEEECEAIYYVLLMPFAIKAREEYRKGRSLHFISNDDLLQKTHSLVCGSEEARAYFAEKYQCIYVDEFQDTDQIQMEFIWRLAATKEDPQKLRDGALFLVGDPKQSIYRFRGAQPEVYFSAKEKMRHLNNAKVYCLNFNYRSNEKIISWVNNSFQNRSLSDEKYQDMIVKKKLPDKVDEKLLAGVYCFSQSETTKKLSMNEIGPARREDAELLADMIWKLHHSDYEITDYDNEVPYRRAIRYADFLVLCYSKKNMEPYIQAMAMKGIQVQVDGELQISNNYALTAFVRIFDYLTHPYQADKRIGARETLHAWGLEVAEEKLKQLKEAVKGMESYGIALYLSKQLKYLLPLGKEISDEELLSAQTKLEQMLESVFADTNAEEEALSERFWRYLNTTPEREMVLEKGADAVHFMNIHKAKGLEGKIVILTKRDENMDFRGGDFRRGKEYYPSVSDSNGSTQWYSYSEQQDVLDEACKADFEEKNRLQYVAATRSEQVLIVMDALSPTSMFTGFDLSATAHPKRMNDILANIPSAPPKQNTVRSINILECKAVPPTGGEDNPQRSEVYQNCTPSSLERTSETRKLAKKQAQGERKRKLVDVKKAAPEEKKGQVTEASAPEKSKRPVGNIFGIVMHRSLQLLIDRWSKDFSRKPEEMEQLITTSMNQAIMESWEEIGSKDVKNYRSFLLEVLSCFADWACREAIFQRAEKVYTEFPFSYYENAGETPVWMNGTADLIIQNPDGSYWILDYKSDHDEHMTEEEFVQSLGEIYSGQLAMYRRAITRLFKVKEELVSSGIISFAGTEKVKIRYTQI